MTQKFGRYHLIRKIAAGGMAEIFHARLYGAEGFERDLVIKKILPQWSSDRDFTTMLIDEAKIAVQLTHPNIIQVYELGREDGVYYIAMEYLNGVDLRRIVQKASSLQKKVPQEVSLMILIDLLEGLAYAHSKKDGQGNPLEIIHRDISPQNILVSYDGTSKITDFGIARAASKSHETMTGVIKGKFAYMSPEQANQESLDQRSDLFSVAIILYEILTGERLFYRGSEVDTLDRIRRGHVTFSEEAEKSIPEEIKGVLRKALAKDREARYTDAMAFREALLDFARSSKQKLRRERVASFVCELFEEERHREECQKREDITRQIVEDTVSAPMGLMEKTIPTKILLEPSSGETRTEVLVQAPFVTPPELKAVRGKERHLWWVVGGAAVGIFILVFLYVAEDYRNRQNEMGQKAIAVSLGAPPQPLSDPRPKPRETTPPETRPLVSETMPTELKKDPPMVSLFPDKKKDVKESPQKENHVKKDVQGEGQGYVSVQAIPWGDVFVDGSNKSLETPVQRLVLRSGRHVIKVVYEPDGSSLSSTIQIRSGAQILCVADFRGERRMRCGG